jgi:UPF0755 protein
MSHLGFRMDAPQPAAKRPWPVIAGAAALVLVAAFIISKQLQPPADYSGAGTTTVKITVEKGDTGRRIGVRLHEADVIASVDAWLAAISNDPRATKIAPGDYNMRKQMSASDAFALILDPASRAYLKLVIPEGMRAVDIIARAVKATGIPQAEFDAALKNPDSWNLPKVAGGNPEGFLFPATYEISKDDTAVNVLKKMTARWQQAIDKLEVSRRASGTGFTVYQILTIASIVEVESGPKDYSKVARVVVNRLHKPMRLQLDSTVNYGLGTTDLHLTQAQLDIDTPYNMHLHDGLPPTPIGNPGEAAIEAVLEPADGSWLYFVTVDVKKQITKFATTYEEFLKYKAEFNRNAG